MAKYDGLACCDLRHGAEESILSPQVVRFSRKMRFTTIMYLIFKKWNKNYKLPSSSSEMKERVEKVPEEKNEIYTNLT